MNQSLTSQKQEADVDQLFENTASNLTLLYSRANQGEGGRARVLFFALAAFLNQEGIVDALKAAAEYMADHDVENRPTVSQMIQ